MWGGSGGVGWGGGVGGGRGSHRKYSSQTFVSADVV